MRYLSGLALVVAASLLPALAAGASLPPFSAEYRIYVNKIPTPIKADLVLKPASGEDRYHMRFEAHSWLLNNREVEASVLFVEKHMGANSVYKTALRIVPPPVVSR